MMLEFIYKIYDDMNNLISVERYAGDVNRIEEISTPTMVRYEKLGEVKYKIFLSARRFFIEKLKKERENWFVVIDGKEYRIKEILFQNYNVNRTHHIELVV